MKNMYSSQRPSICRQPTTFGFVLNYFMLFAMWLSLYLMQTGILNFLAKHDYSKTMLGWKRGQWMLTKLVAMNFETLEIFHYKACITCRLNFEIKT